MAERFQTAEEKQIRRGKEPVKPKRRHSLAFALFARSVIDVVLSTAYCCGMFVLFWLVLDDPVNFPGLFPLRIDTFVQMIFVISLLSGLSKLAYLQRHYDRVLIGVRATSIDAMEVLEGKGPVARLSDSSAQLEHSLSVLRHADRDWYFYFSIYTLAAVLPWNIWGYTRETLFGGLALFIPIVWFLFALSAYLDLFCLPRKMGNPLWADLDA